MQSKPTMPNESMSAIDMYMRNLQKKIQYEKWLEQWVPEGEQFEFNPSLDNQTTC